MDNIKPGLWGAKQSGGSELSEQLRLSQITSQDKFKIAFKISWSAPQKAKLESA